jgi:hypothetical protein
MNVNDARQVNMMLFGAIHREARVDLDHDYLLRLVDCMLEQCQERATSEGVPFVAVTLESASDHLARWQEAGFFVADDDYHEPIGGRGWRSDGGPRFFEQYTACVRPYGDGLDLPRADVATRSLSALLLDHYGLPAEHPQVQRSLTAAAAC